MSVRIERTGKVTPLTPRFMRFMHEALGGLSLDDIQVPSQTRADFACLRGLLAVEVKSLEDDASVRLSNLVRELEEREDWPIFYGTWPMESVMANLNDPEAAKRRVTERVGRRIVKDLREANEQLAAHAMVFPRANLVRLVVLINEDHEVYDPAVVAHIVNRALARMDGERPKYESIDAVTFLSERHATQIGDDLAFPVITIAGKPTEDAPWKLNVLDFVVRKWSGWVGARHVLTEAESAESAINSFGTIEHISDQMSRQDGWSLEYRRNPYMRSWSYEQVRDRWDEVIIAAMFTHLEDAPLRPSKGGSTQIWRRFTHLMDETAHRGLSLPMFESKSDRMIEAATRMKVPDIGLAWLEGILARKPGARDRHVAD